MVEIKGLDGRAYVSLTEAYGSRWAKEVKPHEFVNLVDVLLNSSVIVKYNMDVVTLDLGSVKTSLDSSDFERIEIR